MKLSDLFHRKPKSQVETLLTYIDVGARTIYGIKQEVRNTPLNEHFEKGLDQTLAMCAELRVLFLPLKEITPIMQTAVDVLKKRIDDEIAHFNVHKDHDFKELKTIDTIIKNSDPKNPAEAMEQIMKVPGVVGVKVVDMKTGQSAETGITGAKKKKEKKVIN